MLIDVITAQGQGVRQRMGVLVAFLTRTINGLTLTVKRSEFIVVHRICEYSYIQIVIPIDLNERGNFSITIIRSSETLVWHIGEDIDQFFLSLSIEERYAFDIWVAKVLTSEHYYLATLKTLKDIFLSNTTERY